MIQTRQVTRRLAREQAKQVVYKPYDGLGRIHKRHIYDTRNDVVNNRKRTKGRNVQYQIIPLIIKKGKEHILIGLKTIKHIVPTTYMIKLQKLVIKSYKI